MSTKNIFKIHFKFENANLIHNWTRVWHRDKNQSITDDDVKEYLKGKKIPFEIPYENVKYVVEKVERV